MPKAATSTLLLLFTQGDSKTLYTAYSSHTGGKKILMLLQKIGQASSAIICMTMTNCTKIKLEQVHRKVDLCEKRLERLAWLPYENKDWKGICSLFTYRV